MKILRRRLDYAGMKYSPKKEPFLISQILTPSSFPYHNVITTSECYRSVLNRIRFLLFNDVEVRQAMLNYFPSLYRTQILQALEEVSADVELKSKPALEEVSADVELKSKLDWVEYNKLLK